jgi:hypothetical protein
MIAGHMEGDANVILGLQIGIVTDNKDPEGRYRVKIQIPGIIDADDQDPSSQGISTDWAPPMGTFGGGPQRGGFVVPSIGAKVGVLFTNGDVDSPNYLCAGWYNPPEGLETPQPANGKGADSAQIACLQLGNFVFSVDEHPDKLVFSAGAVDKTKTPNVGISIVLDFLNGGVIINATSAILLRTLGLIHLDALTVRLKDRLLAVSSAPS